MRSRIGEFIGYHINGDGECNGALLKAWADKNGISRSGRFDLAFFYSTLYNIPSAAFMLKTREELVRDPHGWCEKNAHRVIYQSDRRYMRYNGRLESTLRYFSSSLAGGFEYLARTTQGDEIDTREAIQACLEWPNFGRFGAYLFVETLTHLLGAKPSNPPKFDFASGATATSGLMNVYGLDAEANEFDKCKKLPSSTPSELLDELLGSLIEKVEAAGGNGDISNIETSLCAYRKFFKGSRYNGYYLDRQLEELVEFPSLNGECLEIIEELYELRSVLFDRKYLGECCGWLGIRPRCKKLYRDYGVMM